MTIKLYAVRSDENILPVVEIVEVCEGEDDWGKTIFRAIKPLKYENRLYPYDSFKRTGYVKSNSISDCYSKGYIFHTMSDAVKRIELLTDKKERKMEEIIGEFAEWKARLDNLKVGRN